ncbi:MAG: DNA polymerase III subunit alpha, partial [Anaerolineaceae bacterium]|nr:DNA polymerase III subunit alpha [Anaerolineaceae bacterium]
DIDNIPVDDEATYDFLGLGKTAGVFQLEGTGMTRTLVQMQPRNLRNIIALISLYRPGPMQFIPEYISCYRGEKQPEYKHPKMVSIFEETFGIPVYQEQIMFAAIELANYSASESDDLRKAIAKKKADKVEKHRSKFVKGCVGNGIAEEVAAAIFEDWEAFASYGFNKSHAADYALVAIQTAYLKCHYPVEYMAALLSVYHSSSDKVGFYISDCRDMGIEVLPPEINASGWDFTIENTADGKPAIRFGMGAIKNVGHGPAQLIVAARGEEPFVDVTDFARRVDLKQAGKRALESLIRVGALDVFGPRRSLLEGIERIIAVSASHQNAASSGQLSFFGFSDAFEDHIELPPALEMDQREVLEWERDLLGLFVSAHPMDAYARSLRGVISHYSAALPKVPDGRKVITAGILTRCRPYVTKSGKPMAFASIEDIQGPIELVVFPRVWKQAQRLFEIDNVLIVSGTLDNKEGEDPKLLVDDVRLAEAPAISDSYIEDDDLYGGREAVGYTDDEPEPDEPARPAPPVKLPAYNAAMEPPEFDDAPPFDLDPPPMDDDWGFETTIREHKPRMEVKSKQKPAADKPIPPASVREERAPWEEGDHPDRGDQDDREDRTDHYASKAKVKPTAKKAAQDQPVKSTSAKKAENRAANTKQQSDASKVNGGRHASEMVAEMQPPARNNGNGNGAGKGHGNGSNGSNGNGSAKAVEDLPRLDDEVEPAPKRKLYISLKASGHLEKDRRRLRRVYGELKACPGEDDFAFYVYENGARYLIDFPNEKTGICPELLQRLQTRVGGENIEIVS